MAEEKIMTLHPAGKKGTHILKRRYDVIRDYILKTVEVENEISYETLNDRAEKEIKDFDGKINWYIVTVKLDLEARGMIERIPKTSPHRIRLKK